MTDVRGLYTALQTSRLQQAANPACFFKSMCNCAWTRGCPAPERVVRLLTQQKTALQADLANGAFQHRSTSLRLQCIQPLNSAAELQRC